MPPQPPLAETPRKRPLAWTSVLLLAALHALLFWAAFHPLALFPLAWVAFVPFGLIVARGTVGQALAGGFLAAFAGGGAAVFWLTLFGPEPWAGTALGFGLYGLYMAAVGRPLARALPAVVWLPLIVCSQEYLRGHLFFFAFPWVYLGHSQHALAPLVQAADLGGAILVSLLPAAGGGVLLDRLLGAPRRTVLRGAVGVGAAALAFTAYGFARTATLDVIADGPRILAVQANIPQELKDGSMGKKNLLQTHYDLTLRGIREGPVDVVVWPETMVPIEMPRMGEPWPFHPALPYAALDQSVRVRSWFEDLGRRTGARMIVGSLHAEVADGRVVEHNSAFYLDASGRVLARYDKMFPAPMSENTPFEHSWPWLYRFLRESFVPPGFSQFQPGKDVPPWELPRAGATAEAPGALGRPWRVGASVCFDVSFPEASNIAVRNGADAVINVSNYGWFKDSAELDLARIHTMFRAIETRRGFASVCNGGITHFVDPLGRVEDLVAVHPRTGKPRRKLVEGTMTRALATTRARTLFVALGDWPGAGSVIAALGGAAASAALARRRRRRDQQPAGAES